MNKTTLPVPTDENRAITVPEQSSQEITRQQEQWIAPAVDIYETEEGLTVVADLPGVNQESVNVEVKDDLLTLQAKTNLHSQGTTIYQEFQLNSFFRQFRLANTVDNKRIRAELKHGVLTLFLPKAEEAKPRKVEVHVA